MQVINNRFLFYKGHEDEDPEPEVDNLKIESVSSENMFSNTVT